jgi:hypothetical protein
MDNESGIITEANILAKLLDGSPLAKFICGDKSFDIPQNHLLLNQLNIPFLLGLIKTKIQAFKLYRF